MANSMVRNENRANAVIQFIERLPITIGEDAGKRFRLRDWQKAFIRDVYEPCRPDGKRAIRRAIFSVARKNGKSELIAALILAALIGPEAELNGEIYSAANDRAQASIVFNAVKRMVTATPALHKYLTIVNSTKTIFVKRSDIKAAGSKFQALSADAGTKHGLNPSFVVYDELAQARSRELFDVLATSMGGRAEPLMAIISTQNDDPQHILNQMIDDGLSGGDPATVCHLHAAPDGCDIMDETAWYAANPALGDFRDIDEFRTMAARANRLPSEEAAFRLLYLNQRVSALPTLVPRAEWEAAESRHDRLKPGDAIYLGLDMSQTTDLTALVAVSVEDHSRVQSWFWKPGALIADHAKRDSAPYDVWVKQGHMIAAPGKIIDPEAVARHVVQLASIYDIKALAYDRYGINALLKEFDKLDFAAQEGEGDGLRLEPCGQGFASMSPAVTAFEIALLTEDLSHDGNPVLTRCVMNAVVRMDPAGNRKLDKEKSTGRIDGAVSLAMAIGLKARDRPDEKPDESSPWDDPNFSIFG